MIYIFDKPIITSVYHHLKSQLFRGTSGDITIYLGFKPGPRHLTFLQKKANWEEMSFQLEAFQFLSS